MAKVQVSTSNQSPEFKKTVTLPADPIAEKPLVIQPTEPVKVQNPVISPTAPTYAEQRGLTSGGGSSGTQQVSNAPNYVQENAMANNVTRKPLETGGMVESYGQVSPDTQKVQTPGTYSFGGRNINMEGTPNASPVTPTMTTKELSELQDLSRIQKEGQTLSGIGEEKYKGLLEKYHLAKSNEKPEDRVAEINKNLTEGAKNAPQLFNDRKTFENSYGYAQKPQNEKDALDAFWKTNQEEKKNALVDTILNGGSVPDAMKNTVDYALAQKSASVINQFKASSGADILDAIDSGILQEGGADFYRLQALNPTGIQDYAAKKQAKADADAINFSVNSLYTSLNAVKNTDKNKSASSQSRTIEAKEPTITKVENKAYADEDPTSVGMYKEMVTDNPQVNEYKKKISSVDSKLDDLEDQQILKEDEIRARYPNASEDYISAKVNAETNDIIKQKLTLTKELNSYTNLYTGLITEAKTQIDYIQKDAENKFKQSQLQQAEDQFNATQKLDIAKTQLSANQFQQTRGDKFDMAEVDRQNAIEMVKLQDSLKDIPTQVVNTGTEMRLVNSQTGETISSYKVSEKPAIAEKAKYQVIDKEGNYGWVNPETETVTKVGFENPEPNGVDIATFSTVRKGSSNVQCGELVNDYWKSVTGSPAGLGNTLNDKYEAISNIGRSEVPQVGGIFVSNPLDNSVGHTGIVQSVNEDGSVTVREANSAGKAEGGPAVTKTYTPEQVKDMRFSVAPEVKETEQAFNPADVEVYNSLTPTAKKKLQSDPNYIAYIQKQKDIMSNPESSIEDVLDYSRGGKDISDTAETQLSKFNQALGQLGPLQESVSKTDTGPILGALRSYNPYDTDAQKLKAQINSLVPNLARGVYGEVGVLTDNDIANYSKTVPNLKSTTDVNNAILAMTLQTVANGYKSKLQSLAAAGRDVSGYGGIYKDIQAKVDGLLAQVGGTTTQAGPVHPNIQNNISNYFK